MEYQPTDTIVISLGLMKVAHIQPQKGSLLMIDLTGTIASYPITDPAASGALTSIRAST